MRMQPPALIRTGRGEPVLLLHGLMMSHHNWRRVIDRLADDHELLAVTMPGHWGGPPLPRSERTLRGLVDGVERMLDEAGWPTCHIVGNSLGGWVALELAKRGRARSVVVIAAAGAWRHHSVPHFAVASKFFALAPLVALRGLVGGLPARIPLIRNLLLRIVSVRPDAVETVDAQNYVYASMHSLGYLAIVWSDLRRGGMREIEKIATPVQVVLCERDRILPPRHYSRLYVDRLPQAGPPIVLRDLGHVPMLENPDVIADIIRTSIAAAGEQVAT
ncbi:alpha/beta hydrolase [Nocardia sp. CDC153]|uniref:alpha/beta fold hydrolase n=1 Tax=Nocardia sp. CDC153 TaxID=3112167 RepID=UPI002DB65AB3|nr:alpha/beta hydrolase [Nocardia sp. CDC153]MEC3956852.1 alpha/beta hydrolase [Nocardia sp. CDC153]